MPRQIGTAINPKLGTTPSALTATGSGTGVDCSGYEEVVYVQMIGAVSGTTPTLDTIIEESLTSGGTYTAIAGAVFAQVTTATHQFSLSARVNPLKPFQRVTNTIAGTTPSFTMSVAVLRVNPPLVPAAAGA